MNRSVPRFARSLSLVTATLLLGLAASLPARADDMHDGDGLECGPGRDTVYPGFRVAGSFGYTDDVSSGAPSGFIGVDVGIHKEVLVPGLSVGAVVGWYGLGDADIAMGDVIVQAEYSLIPAWGQVTYDFMHTDDMLFQGSAGAGAYNKRISEVADCDCTDFGINLGFGVLTRTRRSTNFGAEIRYHHLPREDNSGNKYLTLMARLTFDFGGYGRGM
ncbi:MAG TPA: hypothetical protein VF720_13445 [Candidatus Eisenbacteria bacterium]